MSAHEGVAIPQSLKEDTCFRFSEIHHHWAGAMRTHEGAIAHDVDTNRRDRMLRLNNFGERLLQVLDVFLHAALNSSRNAIVDISIVGEQRTVCIPFTIVHRKAITRENILDFNLV